jgi:hypothetical protein
VSKLADVIPWHVAEKMYAKNFPSKRGTPTLAIRMSLGAMIIKEKLGLSDMETVKQIKKGPYLQYFIGLESFQYEAPFDASMLTHFRKRLKHPFSDGVADGSSGNKERLITSGD